MRTRLQSTNPGLKPKSATATMGPFANSPLRLLILPKNTSPNARFYTLAHPRTSQPSRYYFCPQKGAYEFKRIAAPNAACQSWLLGPEGNEGALVSEVVKEKSPIDDRPEYVLQEAGERNEDSEVLSNGYVLKNPELFVATPIDLLFLVLPAFVTKSSPNKSSVLKSVFLSLEDLLESLRDSSKHLEQTVCQDDLLQSIEARIMVVCDMVEAGKETMYRLNLDKLLQELLSKARKAVSLSLPASMEENFIRKALDTPTMALKRDESLIIEHSKASQEDTKASDSGPLDGTESQSSTTTVETAFSISSAGTEITNPDVENAEGKDDELAHLLRLRTALSYTILSYLPSFLSTSLNTKLCSVSSPVDFAGLDQHLAHLSALRAEVLASRSMSDFSRKRSLHEDDEAGGLRAEKKRKKEDEEKTRKAGESRGVRDLKKVDISGMKKISDFFGKGAVKKTK